MNDIEKEMYHRVVEIIPEGNSKEFKAVASACYWIHRRETIKLLEEFNEQLIKMRTPKMEQGHIEDYWNDRLLEIKG